MFLFIDDQVFILTGTIVTVYGYSEIITLQSTINLSIAFESTIQLELIFKGEIE